MKKISALLFLYLTIFLQSCFIFNPCGNSDFRTFYKTIETARGLLFSFDENGIFPEIETFNRNELGILVGPDSISERVEVAQLAQPFMNTAYACDDPTERVYTNSIDSINVFTKFRFNSDYGAGANINDLLDLIDIFGETFTNVEIEELSVVDLYLKFSTIPESDSIQFIITGKIAEKEDFSFETELVILSD